MRSKTIRCTFLSACVVAFLSASGASCAIPTDASIPRLVVLIVVDQLPAAHLDRFAAYFGERGFRRLVREGRLFTDAHFAHNTTSTAPGHTVIGTGRYGASTGIVGNTWFALASDLPVYCADGPVLPSDPTRCAPGDAAAKPQPGNPRNPCFEEGPSLARRVKSRWPKSRVVGVSIKDRSAILTLGEGADAAYWFDADSTQQFVSSAFYRPDLARIHKMNAAVLPRFASLLDASSEDGAMLAWQFGLPQPRATVCPDDDISAHASLADLRPTYPHRISSGQTLIYTPYGNDLLVDFARAAAAEWDLGRNPAGQPDVLFVGLSSSDLVGHLFGPDSCEVADMMARLDATLAGLIEFLDERVGRDRSVVVLTSDHGVSTAPEILRRRGQPGGRVYLDTEPALTIGGLPPLRRSLEHALAADTGETIADDTPIQQAFVRAFAEPFVYLNRWRTSDADLPLLRRRVKSHLLSMEGIEGVYTAEEIRGGQAPESVKLAFRADRSGDLVVLLKPGYIYDSALLRVAASHGQPYDYDAQVPVIVRGKGVVPATVRERVDMARVAPTLARLLDLDATGFAVPDPLPLDGGKSAKLP